MRAQRAASNRQPLAHPHPDTGPHIRAQRTNGSGQAPAYPFIDTHPRTQSRQPAASRQPEFPRGAADTAASAALMRSRRLTEGLHLIEQVGLSRAHRRLFLLIDGSSSLAELVRLMGREEYEVQALLHELAEAGLIQP